MWLLAVLRVVLALLSLLGARWAYVAFMVLGLLYFPMKDRLEAASKLVSYVVAAMN